MKRKARTWTDEEWIAKAEAEPPDPDRYVPEGMIRLKVRAYVSDDCGYHELLAPAGHPVYPTLIGVEQVTVMSDDGRELLGHVHWATPEAVAQSAEVFAEKLAWGEVVERSAAPQDPPDEEL